MKVNVKQRLMAILLAIAIVASAIVTANFTIIKANASSDYMEIPQITVLTHGWGGSATHWSSENGSGEEFALDSDSLVYKLSVKAGNADIYRAHTKGGTNNPSYSLIKGYDTDNNGSDAQDSIHNVSKHIIIVFESESRDESNDAVYSEFKYMLNSVIARVKELNPNGENPIVNLIGHSRGGITNLQYALDYPENVDSLISIGTPYFGSAIAAQIGVIIYGESPALSDINNKELYEGYYQRWIDDYEEKYKDINSIAIGATTTLEYQSNVLKSLGGRYADEISELIDYYWLLGSLNDNGLELVYSFFSDNFAGLKFDEEDFVELMRLLEDEIHYGTWYSDVLVPVDSQQGFSGDKNYYFTKYVKEFDMDNGQLQPKVATNDIPVIHNLETYDPEIHDYILKNIVMKTGDTIDNEISNVGKIEFDENGNSVTTKWQIKIRNTHNETRTYAYNSKMCNFNDAKNWTGLTDIVTFELEAGETKIVEIEANGLATSIAVSSISGNMRYIKYADNLWFHSDVRFEDEVFKMTTYSATKAYFYMIENGIKVSIAGKNGSTWLIDVTNNTGSTRTFYYNQKMCSESDAKNWTGLSHISSFSLGNGKSHIVQIQEYGTASSIAISYLIGIDRYIFYAKDLNASGTMTSYDNQKPTHYTENGIDVAIVAKSGTTWTLQVTNNSGSNRDFEYTTTMCFEGDAKDWKNLSNVSGFSLANGSSRQIDIQEYGFATSIAISYMDGIYRKVFYASDLDAPTGTMSAFENTIDTTATDDGCVAEGTLITLSDGSQKAVEDLTGDEMLLVWNLETGEYDIAPIMFIDSDELGNYKVVELEFSDGTTVDVISEHGFWDVDLNRYVYLDEDASQYIGHSFLKKAGNGMAEVMLVGVEISEETTMAYSPVTYGHLCYYVNGMLSMPGGITGLFNIFEVDAETMTIDEEAFAADIAEYGLFTYEEFYEMYPVSEEVFDAFNGKYLKVAIGKGMITEEQIGVLIERYSEFF